MRARCSILPALLLAAIVAPSGRADAVKLRGKPPFRNVSILGFEAGQLRFRGVSGQVLTKDERLVEWFTLDEAPHVTQAELAAAEGDWTRAAAAYSAAMPEADGWLRGLIATRVVPVYDRAGRFAEAVDRWIELALDEPLRYADRAPRNPGPAASRENEAALTLLEAALARRPPPGAAAAIRRLALELRIVDERPLPEVVARGAPSAAPPLLFAAPADSPQGDDHGLSSRSLVLERALGALSSDDPVRALYLLERSLAFTRQDAEGAWRIAIAQARLALGQNDRAAALFDELARDPRCEAPLRAEASYGAGCAYERLRANSAAAARFRDALANSAAPDPLRAKAADGLRRVAADVNP